MPKFKSTDSAAFKLRVYFTDGNAASLFSRDWRGRKYQPHNGLLYLERYVIRKASLINIAIIYDKRGGADKVIRRYQGGTWTTYENVDLT
ncbi:MAG: hypothetical protein AAF998_09355 [Bacteroidota bacterium]